MPLKIQKLLKITYNDISEFFGLVPDDSQVKEKAVSYQKYAAIIRRRSDRWNLEWPEWSQNASVVQIEDT